MGAAPEGRRAQQWDEGKARKLLSKYHKSGLNRSAFSRIHQVSALRLKYWEDKLGKPGVRKQGSDEVESNAGLCIEAVGEEEMETWRCSPDIGLAEPREVEKSEDKKGSGRPLSLGSGVDGSISFVEVGVRGHQEHRGAPSVATALEVQIGQDVLVRIPGGFDRATLREVLGALREGS